jgi:hypothetical protein
MKKIPAGAVLLAAIMALLVGALPGAASAATLENPAGELIRPGTELHVTVETLGFESEWGNPDCDYENISLPVEILRNNDTVVEAEAAENSSASCSLSGGKLGGVEKFKGMKMRSMTLDGAEGEGEIALSFETEPLGLGKNCVWKADGSMSYSGVTNSFTASGPVTSNICGEATFEGSFNVKDSSGEEVLLTRKSEVFEIEEEYGFAHLSAEYLSFAGNTIVPTECFEASAYSDLVTGPTSKLVFGNFEAAECETALGEGEVHLNGCEFVLHTGERFDITCPPGEQVEMTYEVGGYKTIIPAQAGLRAVRYTQSGGELRVNLAIKGLTSTFKGPGYDLTSHEGEIEGMNVSLSGMWTEPLGLSIGYSG